MHFSFRTSIAHFGTFISTHHPAISIGLMAQPIFYWITSLNSPSFRMAIMQRLLNPFPPSDPTPKDLPL
jgi:hypothetical protein